MATHIPRCEPVPAGAAPLDPRLDLAALACYPCAAFDTVRTPRGIVGDDMVVYPRCAHGYLGCPWLGPRCRDYRPQPHLVEAGA